MNLEDTEKSLSRLAWTQADFEAAGEEVPDKLLEDDIHTEGELMSREEVDSWLEDTYKTFCIVKEQDPELFKKLFDEFIVDIHYLLELGKINTDEAKKLTNIENYQF
jgi:hypothetical protein